MTAQDGVRRGGALKILVKVFAGLILRLRFFNLFLLFLVAHTKHTVKRKLCSVMIGKNFCGCLTQKESRECGFIRLTLNHTTESIDSKTVKCPIGRFRVWQAEPLGYPICAVFSDADRVREGGKLSCGHLQDNQINASGLLHIVAQAAWTFESRTIAF